MGKERSESHDKGESGGEKYLRRGRPGGEEVGGGGRSEEGGRKVERLFISPLSQTSLCSSILLHHTEQNSKMPVVRVARKLI